MSSLTFLPAYLGPREVFISSDFLNVLLGLQAEVLHICTCASLRRVLLRFPTRYPSVSRLPSLVLHLPLITCRLPLHHTSRVLWRSAHASGHECANSSLMLAPLQRFRLYRGPLYSRSPFCLADVVPQRSVPFFLESSGSSAHSGFACTCSRPKGLKHADARRLFRNKTIAYNWHEDYVRTTPSYVG